MRKATVRIVYCTKCNWMLRAAWVQQELLQTFTDEIGEIALRPGTGGIFEIWANGILVFSRKEAHGFPDISHLKKEIRDVIAPERNLGHIDRKLA